MKNPFTSQTKNQLPPKKKSLKELDTVIDEMIDRNPDFIKTLTNIIKDQLKKDNTNVKKNIISRRP